jgi:hypothetical protein
MNLSMDKNKPILKKEPFTTTLDSALLEEIKILAIRNKCATNTLLEEAMRDLLQKYRDMSSPQRYTQQASSELGLSIHEEKKEYKTDH